MVFFCSQEESEPDAIRAHVCVIFNTHPKREEEEKTYTAILLQPVKPLGEFRLPFL